MSCTMEWGFSVYVTFNCTADIRYSMDSKVQVQ